MIENSERGITLNKTLAWTMLVALVSLVWFGGTTVASLNATTENLDNAISDTRMIVADDRRLAVQIEARVRSLENDRSRNDARMNAFVESMNELKAQQRETIQLLRSIVDKQNP
tara:strand:+ start:1096 stop:1437 length:342 start_codon:yes stop_codon:yes gene_type:complete